MTVTAMEAPDPIAWVMDVSFKVKELHQDIVGNWDEISDLLQKSSEFFLGMKDEDKTDVFIWLLGESGG